MRKNVGYIMSVNSIFPRTVILLNGGVISLESRTSRFLSLTRDGPNFVPALLAIFGELLYHCKIENCVKFFMSIFFEELDVRIHYSFHNCEFQEWGSF